MKQRRQMADFEETKKKYGDVRRNGNMDEWVVPITVQPTSHYAGFPIRLIIMFPDNYPFGCPTLQFEQSVYHPQVNPPSYEICQGVYKTQWRAACTPLSRKHYAVIDKATEILNNPQPVDGGESSELLRTNNVTTYRLRVREYMSRPK